MTREKLEKMLSTSEERPVYRLSYATNVDSHIEIGNTVDIYIGTDKKDKVLFEAIDKMNKIENNNGFLFWNNSEEGEKFFSKNEKEISQLFANIVLKNASKPMSKCM